MQEFVAIDRRSGRSWPVPPEAAAATALVVGDAAAGFVPAPVDAAAIAAGVLWQEGGRTALLPGVSYEDGQRADAMHGAAAQALGAVAAGLAAADGLLCRVGVRSRWIELTGGCIASFRTVVTGELFALLRANGDLAPLLAEPVEPGEAFAEGVDHGIAHDDLTAELHAARARVLLGTRAREWAAPYVSGLLIGNDLRIGLGRQRHDQVAVIGAPRLTRLYAAALTQAGRTPREVDGEQAFLSGMSEIAAAVTRP